MAFIKMGLCEDWVTLYFKVSLLYMLHVFTIIITTKYA